MVTQHASVKCECGWEIWTIRWHPAVHLIDHYTFDCPDRTKRPHGRWEKESADG